MNRDLNDIFSTAPFPGLRSFNRLETDIFFGRELQTHQLVERLRNHRFVAVVGASGSGKSSLVRAGLIASLESGLLFEAGPSWRVAEMRPGTQPLVGLAQALLEALGPERSASPNALAFLLATLRRGPLGLAEVLRETPLPQETNLLVLVDQFEEIFRFRESDEFAILRLGSCDIPTRQQRRDESDEFVALLIEALQHHEQIYVVLTMRTDYLGNCAVFEGLPEALNESQYLIPQLNREQRRAAVVGPAEVFCSEVKPDLVNQLLNESNDPEKLPLLQHVLMRMWTLKKDRMSKEMTDDLTKEKLVLTLRDYKEVTDNGTIANSLSHHAGKVYDSLGGSDRSGPKMIAEAVFRALTERTENQLDRRRPLKWPAVLAIAETFGTETQVRAVLDVFRDSSCNFLMPPVQEILGDNTIIDISHESLINHWDQLQKWVEYEAEASDRYRRLCDRAEDYYEKRASPLNEAELDIAEQWDTDLKPSKAWARRYGGDLDQVRHLIRESKQRLALRSFLKGAIWLLITTLIIAVVGVYLYVFLARRLTTPSVDLSKLNKVQHGIKFVFTNTYGGIFIKDNNSGPSPIVLRIFRSSLTDGKPAFGEAKRDPTELTEISSNNVSKGGTYTLIRSDPVSGQLTLNFTNEADRGRVIEIRGVFTNGSGEHYFATTYTNLISVPETAAGNFKVY